MASTDRVEPEVVLQSDDEFEWSWTGPGTGCCRITSGPCVYEFRFTAATAWKIVLGCMRNWRKRPARNAQIVAFPSKRSPMRLVSLGVDD